MSELIPGSMSEWLDQQGLAYPFVPELFRGRLRAVASFTWATEPVNPFDLYMFLISCESLLALRNDSYAISHAGHGVNSYAITVRIAVPGLRLATQEGWGGLYMDRDKARFDVAAMFQAVAHCLALAEARPDRQRYVIASSFRGGCSTGSSSDSGGFADPRAMPFSTWASVPELLARADDRADGRGD